MIFLSGDGKDHTSVLQLIINYKSFKQIMNNTNLTLTLIK